jgi:hypothetical protein
MSLLIGKVFVGQVERLMHLLPESKMPNQALEPTATAVTHRAPSRTLRASRGRGSPLTLGKESSPRIVSRQIKLFENPL